jgi:hypothetical protein
MRPGMADPEISKKPPPDFAPADLSDGREAADWKSRYSDPIAQRAIASEAVYLAALFFTVTMLVFIIMSGAPAVWLSLPTDRFTIFEKYTYAWLGGVFGGTLFDIKWLYHSVAKHMWNADRRLWRLFTPHLSGGLSFAVILLISSGILRIFDIAAMDQPLVSLSLGFLIGYFSDNATAKLAQIAELLFGVARPHGSNPG